MADFIDLTGKTFGKLTVISRAADHVSKNGGKRTAWLCKCKCGNELVVMGLNLTRNHTISCGCARKDGRNKLMTDITNQRFGKLVALHPVENNKKGTYWLFRCDCGNEKEMLAQNVKSGKSTSCGRCKSTLGTTVHTQRGIIGNTFDLTGQRFDKLVALERFTDGKEIKYICRCDCGRECIKTHSSLKYGTKTNGSNSCGCIQKAAAKKTSTKKTGSLIGNRYNHLTVLGEAKSKYGKVHWICKCDCGKETIVSTSGLLSGHTKSCGCYQDIVASDTHFINLSGRKYGMLTILERVENDPIGAPQYLCKCDCGNMKIIRGQSIVSGLTFSCGCLKSSVGEALIEDALIDMKIDYKCQVKFSDLKGLGQYPLSYDFGIYRNEKLIALIEYQGKQHFEPIDYFGGLDKFEKQQLHDELKKDYSKSIGVPLIEIPYTANTYEEIIKILQSYGI